MPAAWEIQNIRDNRLMLAILTPPRDEVSLDFAQQMRVLVLPPGSSINKFRGMPYGPARNQAAVAAIQSEFNLAFLDADVLVEPDAFMRLLATGLDLVGGLYYQRYYTPGIGYQPVMFAATRDAQGNHQRAPILGWRPGDIVPCDFVPAGMTIYRHKMLKKLFARWPRLFEWGLDSAPVPTEDGFVVPMSEDFTASYRAKLAGYTPCVHTGVVGRHECWAQVGPKWILPMPGSEPNTGVCAAV